MTPGSVRSTPAVTVQPKSRHTLGDLGDPEATGQQICASRYCDSRGIHSQRGRETDRWRSVVDRGVLFEAVLMQGRSNLDNRTTCYRVGKSMSLDRQLLIFSTSGEIYLYSVL